MTDMFYCNRCLSPSTKPGIEFDAEGTCMACLYHDQAENQVIDWDERQKELLAIAADAKARNNGLWDCCIGVSGGKDSHLQALYAKEELGLHSLLVNCAPDAITDVGRANLENLVQQGFDLVSFRPNPKIMRAVIRRAFYEYGNPVKPSEYPLFAVTFQFALKYKIPLVIQGENPGLTLGSTKSTGFGGDATAIAQANTLQGGHASDWVGEGVEARDLLLYQFPKVEDLNAAGVKSIFLQYYLKEWSPEYNTQFSIKRGLQGREELPWRLNRYASVDGDIQLVNPVIKYYKFGYSNMTDAVNHRIRQGSMTREEAIERVEKWDHFCEEKFILEFCDYIGISLDDFWAEVEKWMNQSLFNKTGARTWEPRFKVGIGLV